MAQTVPTSIPASFSAGDSVQWLISLSDYLASDGWQLHYTLNKLGTSITIDSSASGDDHLIDISASTSAAYTDGEYQYVAWVDGVTSQRKTIASGNIKILPNLAAKTSGYDSRTAAKKCLDDLDAALASYGNKAYTQEYSIADRRMKFTTQADFMAFRAKVKAEVVREQAIENVKLGKPSGTKVLVRY
jgi:hypothetical protein